jgi:SNF2 family DNA or RNA helicase
MDSIESLDQEESDLVAKLGELRDRKKKIKEEAENKEKAEALILEQEKEIVVTILSVQGGNLMVSSLARTDVLELWKEVKGRAFKGYERYEGPGKETPGRNLIPIKTWPETEEKLLALPNTSISWDKEATEKYDWLLNAPPWEVEITTIRGNLAFKAKAGPEQNNWTTKLGSIPGNQWNWSDKFYDIPMSEGWRIFDKLHDVEGVVYAEDARILIMEQVENRGKLDKIAKAEDSSDPRIKQLNHEVFNPRSKKLMPFHEALLPFQRVGIEFLLASGGRTILADKTGLGKTWQMLGFAEVKRMEKPDIQIVCEVKGANIPNWVREIKNLTGEDAVICSNNEKMKNHAYHEILGERKPYILISHDMLGTYVEEIEDTSNTVVRKYPWADLFNMIKPEILLLDEGHKVKNPDANRTKATKQLATIPYVIPATASPILNRTEELWPLLFMADPIMFHSQQQFKNHYTWDGRTAKNVEELHEMLRPRFIRRLRKDVQKDLPPINRQTKIVELSAEAMKEYKIALEGFYAKLALYDPKGKKGEYYNITNMLVELGRLKQICAADKVEYVADLAVDLIDQAENGGKVLIFSQYKATANHIARLLGNQAACTVTRSEDSFNSMNSTQRDELFENARNDDYIKFIVTTEAAQEGHNLEFCDYVIFNDQFWTPAAHDQCEGRAYGRLANPHTIDSFYVVADVPIEEFIQELLEKKLAIIEETVEGVESTRDLSGSIAMELIKKMKEEMYRR